MMRGIIEHGLHPRLPLDIAGAKNTVTLPVLVDTGFDVDIALHYDYENQLGLEIYDIALFDYASGESQEELLCRARVKWQNEWHEVDVVLSADEEPAIGTRLLQGCIMTMDFIENTLAIDKPLGSSIAVKKAPVSPAGRIDV